MSSSFTKQIELPMRINMYIPLPSYYHENDMECIIISTDFRERRLSPGLYKYNLTNNTIELLYHYPSTFEPCSHGQFLDCRNSKL